MSVEPNDTIFEANESDVSSEETPSSISSTIQDEANDADPDNTIDEAIATGIEDIGQSVSLRGEINNFEDVDLYQFQLDAQEAIVADIDIMSPSSRLRLFDESGNELDANFTNLSRNTALDRTGGEPFFTFVAETAGNYYVGVSIFRNPDYDPINPSITGDAPPFVNSAYELNLDRVEVCANNDLNTTISEAIATELDELGESASFNDALDAGDDVDIYQVQIDAGESITIDLDAAEFGSDIDSSLRLFDVSGNLLTENVHTGAPEEERGFDSYLTYTARTTADYYIGVSSFRNNNYDPVNGKETNLPEGEDYNNGSYQLNIDLVEAEVLPDPDDSIPEAIATGLDNVGESATFSNDIAPGGDLDLYQVQLDSGEGLILDLDADEIDSDLTFSVLLVYDADGNRLDTVGFPRGPEEEFSLDPYRTFLANTTGDYYIAVSSGLEQNYNPLVGLTNLAQFDVITDSGSYELNIDKVNSETDPDNTIGKAIATRLENPGDSIIFNDAISIDEDIDIYQVQLDAGEGINIDIDAEELNSHLNSRLRLFDADGNEIASNTHNPAPGEESSTDSYLSFIPEFTGVYYFGVSDISNDDYDPNEDLAVDFVAVPNDYQLEVSLFEAVSEEPEVGDDALLSSFERITGTDNSDALFGNAGSTFVDALSGDDVVTGAGNSDYFIGGGGSDLLSGNNGDDTLIGGNGFDVLSGGEGNDFLQGDQDSNILFGGEGADIFALGENTSANNTITDFEVGIDKIQLGSSSSFWDLTIEEIASVSAVAVSASIGHGITTILGVNSSNLSTSDFLAG